MSNERQDVGWGHYSIGLLPKCQLACFSGDEFLPEIAAAMVGLIIIAYRSSQCVIHANPDPGRLPLFIKAPEAGEGPAKEGSGGYAGRLRFTLLFDLKHIILVPRSARKQSVVILGNIILYYRFEVRRHTFGSRYANHWTCKPESRIDSDRTLLGARRESEGYQRIICCEGDACWGFHPPVVCERARNARYALQRSLGIMPTREVRLPHVDPIQRKEGGM